MMKKLQSLLFSIFSLFLTTPVLASRTDDGGGGDAGVGVGEEPPKIGEIAGVLDKVMDIVFPVAGILCVIFIIIGGYMWIASAGDPAKVKQAQGTLTWAIIGLVFVLIVRLIVSAVIGALD